MAMMKKGGGTPVKGRSPFKGPASKSEGPATTNYRGRPSVPAGKPKDVSMSTGGGNRKTAKSAMIGDGGDLGASFCGHGGFTRK
jgi:hypothetical protein